MTFPCSRAVSDYVAVQISHEAESRPTSFSNSRRALTESPLFLGMEVLSVDDKETREVVRDGLTHFALEKRRPRSKYLPCFAANGL